MLRIREFRFLLAAEVLSVAGDQLARVALAVLVFDRTGSASWAAGVYALTFLPALLGGVLLSGLADRHPRREVMVAADVLRAGLVAVMALPGLPVPVLSALLVAVVLLGAPFTAAQGALLPEILPGERYERGLALRQMTGQSAQLAGFAAGGAVVAVIGTSPALLANAGTFAVSAALIRFGLVRRPAPGAGRDEVTVGHHHSASPLRKIRGHTGSPLRRMCGPLSFPLRKIRGVFTTRMFLRGTPERPRPAPAAPPPSPTPTRAALRSIAADPRRRSLLALAWLVGWYVVPEALAAPYAAQIGAGAAAVGLLMAADPLGSIAGAWLFTRYVPARLRERLIGPLAVAAGLPLLLAAARPGVAAAAVLWGLSGMLSTAYLLQAQASFVRATPEAERGRAIGVAASGLLAAQGAAVFLGGLLADRATPAVAITVAGATGAALCVAAALSLHSATRTVPDPVRAHGPSR